METRNLKVILELKCGICGNVFSSYKKSKKFCSKKCTDKDYSLRHKDEKKAYDRVYNAINSEKNVKRAAAFRQKNKSKRWEIEKKRLKENPKLAIYKNVLTVMRSNIKKGRASSYNKTFKRLGYSLHDLMAHLRQTLKDGYTWEDFLSGKLHIDHIKPHSLFEYSNYEDAQFKECWSLNNLRLLPKHINVKRGNNYEPFGSID